MATPGGVALGLLGSAASEAAAFAAGIAIGPTLAPELRFLENEAWNIAQTKPLDPSTAAQVAAENFAAFDAMAQQAAYNGLAGSLFQYLYDVTLTAPGAGLLLQMARRQTINPGNFLHGLRKAKLEPMWNDALVDLQKVYLSPDILAVMVQRNVIPNQGQLPGVTRSTNGKVPRFPHVPIDAYAMAKTFGWSQDQLDAQTRIQGLPPGMDLVARMVFRKILDRGDFNLAAEQSNRRVEWADYEFEGYRQIPTALDGVEGRLRGWLTDPEMYAQTARHGMTQDDTDLLLKITGRPMNPRQVFLALRRGGTYDGPIADISAPVLKALRESNIRPEWYNLEWAYRFTQPSVFVVRQWLRDGHDPAWAQTKLSFIGWEQSDIDKFITAYSPSGAGAGAASDPHITKADNQVWTALHSSYVKDRTDDAFASATLAQLGVAPDAVPVVLERWGLEREIVRAGLTAAQIKKAYNDAQFTQPEAVARLVELGWSAADATVYLGETR